MESWSSHPKTTTRTTTRSRTSSAPSPDDRHLNHPQQDDHRPSLKTPQRLRQHAGNLQPAEHIVEGTTRTSRPLLAISSSTGARQALNRSSPTFSTMRPKAVSISARHSAM
ncbi:hypothetical protein TYRP_003930 [Tyrophagus putrescentiae]|nr:hypothetical protein TYRP_003930 [Tyrophagus putrescentiae]